MEGWRKEEVIAMLVSARTLPAEAFRVGPLGTHERLSTQYAVEKRQFRTLAYYEQRWLRACAVAASMPRAALVGRSAARLLGMWVVATSVEPVELCAVTGKPPSKRGWPSGCVYLQPRKRTGFVRSDGRIRVMDELTNAFEIALRHGFREGLVAMDWILRHHTDRATVEAEILKLGKARNIGVLRKVMRYAVANSRSPFESYARAVLIDAGLDNFLVNQPIGNFEVDLLNGRLIIEVDGDYKYDGVTFGRTDQIIRAERAREKVLQGMGYVVCRVSPRQLLEAEEVFIAEVRSLMAVARRMDG